MDQLRRIFESVRTHVGKMTASQQLLVVALVAVVVLTLVIVGQTTSTPSLSAIPGVTPDRRAGVESALQLAGIETRVGPDGSLMVPTAQRTRALAELSQSGMLPSDTTLLFGSLIGAQDWKNSREQNRQQYVIALQNELARIIGQFRGVKEARVIIDAPQPEGLGRAVRTPTASATVFTGDGSALSQETVDAVAHLIAGARSGLAVENVRIIDGSTNRQRSATDRTAAAANNYVEHAQRVERELREKIESLLGYIPGVMVAVTAQVDVTRVSQSVKRHLNKDDGTVSLLRSETGNELSETSAQRGAEPGVRSMQGADINTGSASGGANTSQSETVTEFENAIGTEVREVVDPRGMPTFLAASVNVPEGYVAELARKEAAAAAAAAAAAGAAGGGAGGAAAAPVEPTPAQVRARFDTLRADIESSLRPHLKIRAVAADGTVNELPGEVSVALVPMDAPTLVGSAAPAGFLGMIAGGPGGVLGGSLIDTIAVGGLALVALAMMLMMVKRSGKQRQLPTAEELVGLPPTLETDSDMMGEAEEGESALAGIEVGDEAVKRAKMLEQVLEMVQTDPGKTAKLLNQWIINEQ